MPSLISHAIAAIVVQSLIGALFGYPFLSQGIFVAGFLAMLIDLDQYGFSPTGTTPVGHSVLFGIVWVAAGSALFWLVLGQGEYSIALVSAYASHLALDAFTREGIYTVPKGGSPKHWLFPTDRDGAETWKRFPGVALRKRLRKADDPILNAVVSIASILIFVLLIALSPVPG